MTADVPIVGAGTTGIPAAIFAARRGAKVILAEATDSLDGTLRRAAGHVSAGGTRLQKVRGNRDDPAAHAADIIRITGGTADAAMVTRACEMAPRILAWLDGCCHLKSRIRQVVIPMVSQATFAADFHAWKASSRW